MYCTPYYRYLLVLYLLSAARNFVDSVLNETKSCKRKLDFSLHPAADQLLSQAGKTKKRKMIVDKQTVVRNKI